MLVPIAEIRIGKRLRPVRSERVAALAESIAQAGLQHPISVSSGAVKVEGGGNGVTFDLVAGLHRLEACRSLGWDEIEASIVQMTDDERQLWEIDENLCRADLTELERGEHLAKRKEVYERLHPETKRGGDRRSEEYQTENSSVRSFVDDTADKAGVTDRAVRLSIRRVAKIDEKVRDRIRDNPEIADSGVELDALAALDTAQQRRAVALVEAGQAAGIRDAKRLMEPRALRPNFKLQMAADEKWWHQFLSLIEKASDANRQRAREYLDEPVGDNTVALRGVA